MIEERMKTEGNCIVNQITRERRKLHNRKNRSENETVMTHHEVRKGQ